MTRVGHQPTLGKTPRTCDRWRWKYRSLWKQLTLNAHLMAFATLFIVLLAETGRVPVDNPATHLELTMIHEALLLEYSARHLALMEWAAALKLFRSW